MSFFSKQVLKKPKFMTQLPSFMANFLSKLDYFSPKLQNLLTKIEFSKSQVIYMDKLIMISKVTQGT